MNDECIFSTADTSKILKQQIGLVVKETEESAMDTDSTPERLGQK